MAQAQRDLLVGLAVSDKPQDFDLSRRQSALRLAV
jgi:hypothetical protein